jgi:hypothetical protein
MASPIWAHGVCGSDVDQVASLPFWRERVVVDVARQVECVAGVAEVDGD